MPKSPRRAISSVIRSDFEGSIKGKIFFDDELVLCVFMLIGLGSKYELFLVVNYYKAIVKNKVIRRPQAI